MKQIIRGILLLSTVVISCRSAKKNKTASRSMDTITVSAFNNPLKVYRAAAPKLWNIVHTRVALSFNYAEKTANGQEWISLQPYFYPSDTLTLDAKGMKIESVTIGHADKALKYTYDSSRIHIQLDKIYTQNDLVKLCIKYVAMPYAQATGGSAAITDDRGLYFINTDHKIEGKPAQIWTQGETESNSHWLPTIDKPNMRTTIQLELTVPNIYKTLGNGALISSMDKGDKRTDIWRMDKPIQVYAIMFAIGDFIIAKDQWKGKEVNYYVEPAYAPYARKMFQYTPEMIGFFSDVTGIAYPWNKYSQVVVRDYVSGAMENTSASLFGEFMNQDLREYADANHEDVVSHELFHQWFGDYVTAESWSNLTVNESFATYGEYLWRKHKYGLSYADELAWSDLQRYLSYTEYSDPVLVRHHYIDKEEMFDRVSYQKGGAILHYLHQLVGDSAFYKSMQIYLSKNALQSAEATHWRLAVEEATGKDWNWFFDEWYHRAGHPILDINYEYDDALKKLKVTVKQIQSDEVGLYHLPLKIMVINGKEKVVLDWNITKAAEVFYFDYKNGQQPVIIPDVVHVLPGVIKENKTAKQWLVQLRSADDFVSQLNAIESVDAKSLANEDAQQIVHEALGNKLAALRLAGLEAAEKTSRDEQKEKWKAEIIYIATNDGNNEVRAKAMSLIGLWKFKNEKQLLIDAVKDSSYFVSGNALYALKYIDDSLAYQMAKRNLNGKANTNLDAKAWLLVADKGYVADTTLLIEYAAKKADGTVRKHLVNDLGRFAIKTKNEASFKVALALLAQKIKDTEQKNYRAYYAQLLKEVRASLSPKEKKTALYQYKLQQLQVTAKALKDNEKEESVIEVYNELLK